MTKEYDYSEWVRAPEGNEEQPGDSPQLTSKVQKGRDVSNPLPQDLAFDVGNGTIAHMSVDRALELGLEDVHNIRRNSVDIGHYGQKKVDAYIDETDL